MRVLIVYPKFYIYGGAETLIVQLCNHLTRHGIENGILTTEMKPEIEKNLVKTRVHIAGSLSNRVKHVRRALAGKLSELTNEYDILNPHNFPADLACMLSGKPKVWMCNEPETYLVLQDPRLRKGRQYRTFKMAFLVQKCLYRFFMRKAVVADEFNAARFKNLFGYTPRIINYGVDYDYFSAKPEDNPFVNRFKGRFVVLQSGMMQPFKNQLASLETVNRLKDRIPEILLVLTGAMLDGDYSGKITDYVKEHRLEDHVWIRGHVDREEVRKIYYATDVLLHPIKPQGGWLTPFEFLATGRPIVVSEEFPPRSLLTENGIGTVTADYGEALLSVYSAPETFGEMALRGKEFVRENLQWENYCGKMREFFAEAVGRSGG